MRTRMAREQMRTAFDYIGNAYDQCMYLYANLWRYGVEEPLINTYLYAPRDTPRALWMTYYGKTLHIYTRQEDTPMDAILQAFEEHTPHTAYLPVWVFEKLPGGLTDAFIIETMNLYRLEAPLPARDLSAVRHCARGDYQRIVPFLMTDPAYWEVYTHDALLSQLLARHDAGFGRMLYLQEEGRVAACYGTNAQTDRYDMMAGLLSDPACRGRGFGSTMIIANAKETVDAGRDCCCYISDETSQRIHERLGFRCCAQTMKLIRKTI